MKRLHLVMVFGLLAFRGPSCAERGGDRSGGGWDLNGTRLGAERPVILVDAKVRDGKLAR